MHLFNEIILIERSSDGEYAVTLTRFSKIICSAERIFLYKTGLISFCMTNFLKGIQQYVVEEYQWRLPDCSNDRGGVWWECLLKVGNCCWTLG